MRRICPNCGYEYEASAYEKRILGVNENETLTIKRGKGCTYCNNTGYRGRMGVHEILEVTKNIRDLIMARASSDELRKVSIDEGMRTLRESCALAVINGMTTVDELVKIAFLKEE